MEIAKLDPAIGPLHISLFMAILHHCKSQPDYGAFVVQSRDLMLLAKISAPGTYYKCIHDLERSGYISYIPSHDSLKGTRICVNNISRLTCT